MPACCGPVLWLPVETAPFFLVAQPLQVEGLAGGASPMAVAQLAALGAAASWRLGKWELVEGYVQAAEAGYSKLDTDARWEVRYAAVWVCIALLATAPILQPVAWLGNGCRLRGWLSALFGSPDAPLDTCRWCPTAASPQLSLPQVRIAHLLSGVARKDAAALRRDLEAARSEVMGPFSGGWVFRGWSMRSAFDL